MIWVGGSLFVVGDVLRDAPASIPGWPNGCLTALESVVGYKKPLHRRGLSEWAVRDSNPRPPRCKRGALNQLS